MREDVLVCLSEGSVRVEVLDLTPNSNVLAVSEYFLVDLEQRGLPGASVIMGFQIDIDQKWHELDLELEVVHI